MGILASAPAGADWYDPQGKTNYGSDYYTAAENSFQELWPTLTFGAVTGTSWGYDAQNRVNTFSLCKKPTTGPWQQLCGGALNECAYGYFHTLQGCATNAPPPCPCQMRPTGQESVGDPINVSTGNLWEVATDFATRGQDSLTATRTYNSNTTYEMDLPRTVADGPYFGRYGYGWRSEYDSYIVANSTPSNATAIELFQGDGNHIHFAKSSGVWYVAYWDPQTGWSASTAPRSDVDMRISTDGTSWFVTDGNDTVRTFDSVSSSGNYLGKLLSIKYANGYQQTLAYDGLGNNTTVTDSFNRTLAFTYTSAGLVQTMTDADGKVTQYAYRETGETGAALFVLQTVTYPDSKSIGYIYDDGRAINRFALTGITDELGNRVATWTYDAQGRATSSQHAGSADLTTIAYDDVGNTRTVTNALGKQTIYDLAQFQGQWRVSSENGQASTNTPASTVSYAYDTNGYVSQVTSGEGRVTTYAHNALGQETSRTEGYGTSAARTITTTWDSTWREPDQIAEPGLTKNFTYDASGNLTQLELTDTTTQSVPYSTNGQTRTWNYTYTTTGELQTVQGPLGTGDTTTYGYDTNGFVNSITNPIGQITSITSSNGRGEPLSSTDPNGVVTNYTYDLRGRLTGITVNPGTNAATTSFTLDATGAITEITRPDGSTLSYTWDTAHRLTTVADAFGNTINYTLDAAGDRTQTQVKSSGGTIVRTQTATFDELARMLTSIGASSQTTAYAYDKDDNATSVTDPRSKLYGSAFDALNRLVTATDPDSFNTATAYNGKDEVTSVADARSLTTSYVRDGFGDVIQQTSPDTGTTTFWFNGHGRVTKRVDARNIETDFTYDNADRILTKTFPAATSENVTYTYDSTTGGNEGVGRLTGIADASGSAAFTYDALGRKTLDQRTIQSTNYSTSYSYDAGGNVLSMTYPSGRIVTWARDSMGRISSVATQNNSSSGSQTVVSGASWVPFGGLAGATFGNGVGLTIGYDQDGRVTSINAATGSATIQNLTYGYDAASNITSIGDALNSARSQSFTYDDLDRLASASGAYGALSYSYDGVGNRLTDANATTGASDTFAYSTTANQITTDTQPSNTRTFSYLASGQTSGDQRNATSDYTYAFNNAGRLASASLNGSSIATYLYNAAGQRAAKTVGGTATEFIYDNAGHLIEEANGTGAPIRDYIWLDDMPIGVADYSGGSPVLYFVHADHLNRPQKLTDAGANIVWDGVFDPFGNVVSVSGSATNLLMFPGQYYDSETQLSQNWHRDYDPTVGRYVESDPIGLLLGVNLYVYGESNPVALTDPNGRQAIPIEPPITVAPPSTNPGGIPSMDDYARQGRGLIRLFSHAWKRCFDNDEDCEQEWRDARKVCREELSKPNPNRGITGGHTDIEKCAKGHVSERCGGNPVEW